MKKKIVIESCMECPRRGVRWNEKKQTYNIYVCRFSAESQDWHDDRDIIDVHEIPEWCPLPNDEMVTNPILLPDGHVF